MFNLVRYGRAALLAFVAAAALAGCSMNVPISPEVTADRGTKIDRFVGVYVSEDTRTTTWSEERYGDTWNFPIGQASGRAIEEAATRTFRRSTVIGGLPPLPAGSANVDAVLEAEIEGFSFVIPFLKTSTYRAEITYRFTMHDRHGWPVASWIVIGEGARRGQFGFNYTRWPGEAANLAIEDAMRKFIEETDRNPEVMRWLRESASEQPEIRTGT